MKNIFEDCCYKYIKKATKKQLRGKYVYLEENKRKMKIYKKLIYSLLASFAFSCFLGFVSALGTGIGS